MAKGKRQTALFDVMYSVRKPPVPSSGGGFAMPKWWGKRATKIDPTPPGTPPAAAAPVPPPVEEITPTPPVEVRQVPVPIVERIEEPRPTMRLVQETDEPVAVDPIEREVRFKLSYGGMAAAAFVLVLLLVMVYLAGSRSEPAEQILTVKPNSSAAANPHDNGTGLLAAVVAEPTAPAIVGETAPAVSTPVVAPKPTEAAVANEPPQRQVGMHYVIVQSYPDEKVAQKAADFLNKANIACTVVPALPGWASPSWFTVVGLKPFDHIQHNQDLDDYKQAIEDAGTKFAGRSSFNRFQPTEYKWRAQTDQ